jgi:hypothetical protein
LCFALELEEQKRSGFHYQYSNYQVEYSRNLIFSSGREMDEVFQALIDRSRVLLDLQKLKPSLVPIVARNFTGAKTTQPNGK